MAAADVVASTSAATSVVPPSVSLLVVRAACVLWLGLLCVGVAVVCGSGTAVMAAVLVRRVVGVVVATLPAVDSWSRLDGVVGCGATDDTEAVGAGAVRDGVVAAATLVGDAEALALATALRSEDEVAAVGGVARAVVVGVAVTAGVEAPTVLSSVT